MIVVSLMHCIFLENGECIWAVTHLSTRMKLYRKMFWRDHIVSDRLFYSAVDKVTILKFGENILQINFMKAVDVLVKNLISYL